MKGFISEKRASQIERLDGVMIHQIQVAEPQFAKSLFGAFTMS